MNALMRRIRFIGCAALCAGCISPQYTRLPSLRPSSTAAERNSYVYHDPLPDREAGPAIERPRGFERQRSEPTRTLERSEITDSILGTSGGGGSNNPSASKYPGSVNP
jgi:hypothetical protein